MNADDFESMDSSTERALSPLRWLDDSVDPPSGLADRTIAYVRRQSLQQKSLLADSDRPNRTGFWHSRLDVAVAASLLILMTSLGIGAVGRLHQNQALQMCRNNMFRLFGDLETYASTHDGRFPDLAATQSPAGAFVEILAKDGLLSSRTSAACPAVHPIATNANEVDYTYSLGSRYPDGLVRGPSHGPDADTIPLLADRPLNGWVPRPTSANHSNGVNVLFVNGSVRFCTSPTVGWQGDHIFLNDNRIVAAGLHKHDAVLGENGDRP